MRDCRLVSILETRVGRSLTATRRGRGLRRHDHGGHIPPRRTLHVGGHGGDPRFAARRVPGWPHWRCPRASGRERAGIWRLVMDSSVPAAVVRVMVEVVSFLGLLVASATRRCRFRGARAGRNTITMSRSRTSAGRADLEGLRRTEGLSWSSPMCSAPWPRSTSPPESVRARVPGPRRAHRRQLEPRRYRWSRSRGRPEKKVAFPVHQDLDQSAMRARA